MGVRAVTESGEERFATTGFLYSAPDAQLTGSYADAIVNGNLVIWAEVEVEAPGRFHLEGSLYTRDGRPMASAQHASNLTVGTYQLPLTFSSLAILEAGAEGPFDLKYLSLSTTTAMPISRNKLVQDVHRTMQYRSTDFTGDPRDDPLDFIEDPF